MLFEVFPIFGEYFREINPNPPFIRVQNHFRGEPIPTELMKKMSVNDPVKQVMKDGKEKLTSTTQSTLLTQISSK